MHLRRRDARIIRKKNCCQPSRSLLKNLIYCQNCQNCLSVAYLRVSVGSEALITFDLHFCESLFVGSRVGVLLGYWQRFASRRRHPIKLMQLLHCSRASRFSFASKFNFIENQRALYSSKMTFCCLTRLIRFK